MKNNLVIAYTRVSTQEQGRSGLSLQAQKEDIEKFCNDNRLTIFASFEDVSSGANDDRAGYLKAIELARKTGATIVISKLDRLARKVSSIALLMDEGVGVVSLDLGAEADPMMLHFFAAFAEAERKKISSRVKRALAVKKAKGERLGATTTTLKKARAVSAQKRTEQATVRANEIALVIKDIKENGKVTTLAGIANALNARGFKTPRGGKFYPASVKRVLDKAT